MMSYDEIGKLKPGDILRDVSNPAPIDLTVVKVDWQDKCIIVSSACGTFRYGLFGCSRWPMYADVLKRK